MEDRRYFDVIIVGGSYAGLSAALALGRAIRHVLVVDSAEPCNRQTPHSHNFLTQDGSPPAEIAAKGKDQLLRYPTVHFVNDKVLAIDGEDKNFKVATASGLNVHAKKILFATGVKDQMPDIEGFAACWGISAIHCPYCHGYEFRNQPTGILLNGDVAFEHTRLIKNWTDRLSLFTNGVATFSVAVRQQIVDLGVPIVELEIKSIIQEAGQMHALLLENGSIVPLDALYAKLPFEQHCGIPADLGCEFSDTGHILVDAFQKTTLPGLFAAGDNTTPMRSVSAAVAAGTRAGAFINHELIASPE